jgi:hypothetical protein
VKNDDYIVDWVSLLVIAAVFYAAYFFIIFALLSGR